MADTDEILCSCSFITIYTDRLVIQSKKIIPFNEITCIKAIPCYFRSSPYSEENDVDYFTEIILNTNKKIILRECEDHFGEAFKKYKNVTFNSWLKLDDVLSKFGQTKYFFASLLFDLSPLRITLWTKTDGSA